MAFECIVCGAENHAVVPQGVALDLVIQMVQNVVKAVRFCVLPRTSMVFCKC